MTKKHFIALAVTLASEYSRIQSITDETDHVCQLAAFVSIYDSIESFCTRQNAKFDANRFYAAVFGENK